MNITIHPSNSRGFHDYGWLKSWHSFNFADYFNPVREKFGTIRVINDEVLAPGASIDFHEYRNLEMIIIPLSGELQLIEESGTESLIHDNEVQLISAGKGIEYSLVNVFDSDPTEYLQVWLFPKSKNTEPALWKNDFYAEDRHEQLQVIACPKICSNALSVNQDAWISRIDLQDESHYDYDLFRPHNQLLIFVIEGTLNLDDPNNGDHILATAESRDTVQITNLIRTVRISAKTDCSLLIIETPED